MELVSEQQRQRIHPHKFTLWVAIGSIIMMFAGLTSAFIVKSNQVGWQQIQLPKIFWYSTAVILISSLTMHLAVSSFKQREMNRYRLFLAFTLLLGIAFIVLQWMGFKQLWYSGIQFKGASGAGQFMYVIAGLHALHIVAGVLALMIIFMRSLFGRVKVYSNVPVQIMSTYWHFVDFLWVYLFVFFMWIE
jgi:cytochrome c oxidase subunit 3